MCKKCSVDNCGLEVFNNGHKCVLHCEKSCYSEDYHKGLLSKFYLELKNYIINYFNNYIINKKDSLFLNNKNIQDFILNGIEQQDDITDVSYYEVVKFLNNNTIVFNSIYFPCSDNRDPFDYLKLLKLFKGIHFNYCNFSSCNLILLNSELFFQDCNFNYSWYITECKLLENIDNVLYQCCTFHQDVNINQETNIDLSLFCNCIFKNNLNIGNVILNKPIFNNENFYSSKLIALNIQNCQFNDLFKLNNLDVDSISIDNTTFNNNIILKGINANICKINDCNFNTTFTTSNSIYGDFYCTESTFHKLANFENCTFGNKTKNITKFQYVTFEDITNFRYTKFNNGLDIERINLTGEANFLNTYIPLEGSNRETFRIIKHSFDQVGNHIEANKFFALEMKKYKEELSKLPKFKKGKSCINQNTCSNICDFFNLKKLKPYLTKKYNKVKRCLHYLKNRIYSKNGKAPIYIFSQDKVIFWFNEKMSDFGKSYLKPIFWIFCNALILELITKGYNNNLLYKIYPPLNDTVEFVSSCLNNLAQKIIPFKGFLIPHMEFISLISYIIFVTLTWQLVVAVKRHTKR